VLYSRRWNSREYTRFTRRNLVTKVTVYAKWQYWTIMDIRIKVR
jgi:hypothetical protein